MTRRRRQGIRRTKKGGFFRSKVSNPELCNDTTLNQLLTPIDENNPNFMKASQDKITDLQIHYNTCCPKGFMGWKNSSPYCKRLLSEGNTLTSNLHNEMEGDLGNTPPKKPWYKFWGGKKSKKYKRRHNKRSHKRTHKRHNKH